MNISLTFIITIMILAIALIAWEVIFSKISVKQPIGNTLIYGAGRAGNILAERIIEKCKYNNWDFSRTKLVGFIDDDPIKAGSLKFEFPKSCEIPIFGDYEKLDGIISNHNVTSVIVTIGNPEHGISHLRDVIISCKKHKINCFKFNFKFDRLA